MKHKIAMKIATYQYNSTSICLDVKNEKLLETFGKSLKNINKIFNKTLFKFTLRIPSIHILKLFYFKSALCISEEK